MRLLTDVIEAAFLSQTADMFHGLFDQIEATLIGEVAQIFETRAVIAK